MPIEVFDTEQFVELSDSGAFSTAAQELQQHNKIGPFDALPN